MSDKNKTVFLEYKQRNGKTDEDEWKSGFFELISIKDGYITFKTKENIITLPDHRVYFIKEAVK